jgi:hypothetical protein
MTTDWDALLDRLTRPLRVDPELQREISRELRAHLEDSRQQFRAGGMNEQDAQAAAAKALGNEEEIAQQLWQANRRRVRVRRAVRWVAGITLLPATAVISVSMAWGAIVSIAVLLGIAGSTTHTTNSLSRPLADRFARNVLADAPSDARAVLEFKTDSPAQMLASAKSLTEAHPGDPLYYGNYVGRCLTDLLVDKGGGKEIDRSKLTNVLNVLDHAKQVEPGNGLYSLVKAGLLFETSTIRQRITIGKAPESWFAGLYLVDDSARFELALTELHEAASKPYIDSHAFELVERSLQMLGSPKSLGEEVWRRQRLADTSLPFQQRFYWIVPALWQASELARQSQFDRANDVMRDCHRVAISIANRTELINDSITSRNLYRLSLGVEVIIARCKGDAAGLEHALAAMQDDQTFINRISWEETALHTNRPMPIHLIALADRRLEGSTPKFDSRPALRAEYAIADRLGLSVLLIILTALSAAAGVRAVVFRVQVGRWPAIAFMGWRRLAVVVLVSCLLPVSLYALYTWSPLSGRHRAADSSVERLTVEYAAVACVILALLRTMSDRALRKRAGELDADELKTCPPGRWKIAAGAALSVGVVTFLALTFNGGLPARMEWLFPLLAAGLVGYMLLWLGVTSRQRSENSSESVRRISPAVAWAVITTLLIGAGWILFSHRFSRDFEEAIRLAAALICAAIVLFVLSLAVLQIRRGAAAWAQQSFDYRLSIAPAILLSALVLSLIAGLPLQWEERRAVAAMEASANTFSPSHELEHSPWRALKEVLAKR